MLYEELTHPDPKSQFSAAEQRIDALDVLGIGGSEFGKYASPTTISMEIVFQKRCSQFKAKTVPVLT